MARGGARAGAGRKSAYPGKDTRAVYLDFTPAGRIALRRLERRWHLSRNDVIAHLIKTYARALTFNVHAGPEFPGKAAVNVMRILLPTAEHDLVVATRARTGRSYSDIGEALVLWHGPTAVFPRRPRKARKVKRSPAAA